ncbi:MAG: HNH endonuclease [Chloroflexota bacterium]
MVSEALLNGKISDAKETALDYPFEKIEMQKKNYMGEFQSTQLFLRDGFIDRYSGEKLVFPGLLRLLSVLLPNEFPFHPNWKMSETHRMYWELFPTVDHIVPMARGGLDEEANWVTTSMLLNSAKSNWTLAELNWSLFPVGNLQTWDGLINLFIQLVDKFPQYKNHKYISTWFNAANKSIDFHSNN